MKLVGRVITRCFDGNPWRVVHVDEDRKLATLRGLHGGGWKIVSLLALLRELKGIGGWEL